LLEKATALPHNFEVERNDTQQSTMAAVALPFTVPPGGTPALAVTLSYLIMLTQAPSQDGCLKPPPKHQIASQRVWSFVSTVSSTTAGYDLAMHDMMAKIINICYNVV
jgi:hypothetical protein